MNATINRSFYVCAHCNQRHSTALLPPQLVDMPHYGRRFFCKEGLEKYNFNRQNNMDTKTDKMHGFESRHTIFMNNISKAGHVFLTAWDKAYIIRKTPQIETSAIQSAFQKSLCGVKEEIRTMEKFGTIQSITAELKNRSISEISMNHIKTVQEKLFSGIDRKAYKNTFGVEFSCIVKHGVLRYKASLDVNRLLWQADFFRDVLGVVCTWFLTRDDLPRATEKVAKTLEKYASGRANCQRPSRNSK